tara:strand:+ start:521 stop:874 length:354 start_codon:yes stop_codon:yes gene_type:complete
MRIWKIYLLFSVLSLIVNLVSGYLSDVSVLDIINWGALVLALIGLRGYIYKVNYFSKQFWKLFFPAFLIWSIVYLVLLWLGIPAEDQNLTVASIYGVIFILSIPQMIALYSYGVKNT